MAGIHRELRRPGMQRRIFSFARASPTEIMRSRLSTQEIQNRALTHLPEEILAQIPDSHNTYSLFQGFQATMPETTGEHKRHRKINLRKLLTDGDGELQSTSESILKVKRERDTLNRRLEMMTVRKNMASVEIGEIDNKIANLNTMRGIVLDRLANLEQDEALLEHDSKALLEENKRYLLTKSSF
jgi:division protein 1